MHPAAGAGAPPYVSIVVTARTPDSAQRFVDSLLTRIRRYGLSAELIVVDAAPGLKLPPEVRRVESGAASEWTARNAGLRAARGEFLLSTTVDASLSDELIQFLAMRQLQAGRLYHLERRALPGPRQPGRDIALPDSGIEFGLGWYPLDSDLSGPFRFMENDADLTLRVPAGGGILRMELEPGPSLAAQPQPLQVLDAKGAKLTEWSIAGRDTIRLHVPPASDGVQRICLRVPANALPQRRDTPFLTWRFFRFEWVDVNFAPEQPKIPVALAERHALTRLLRRGMVGDALRILRMRGDDICDAGMEFEPGAGWHYLENAGGKFRWVEPQAELNLCLDDGSTRLAFLVEPGPALGYQPFDLVIRMPGGEIAGKARIEGLTQFEVSLPVTQGVQTTLSFTAEGAAAGQTVPGDSRALAYRVFACVRAPGGKTQPPTDPSRTPWVAHTIRSRPPTTDWQSEQNAERKKALEISSRLHTSSCGDFQLMARENWVDLRGYTEFEGPAEHVDALLTFQAYQLGIREEILAVPVHDGHLSPAPQPDNPWFTEQDLNDVVTHMRTLHAPLIFNGASWGADAGIEAPSGDPYISVVVAARNDNHGGNMLVRMQAFIDSWLGLAQRYNLRSEIIVVEWNPPEGRRRLQDDLRWPTSTGVCKVRFLEVTSEFHRSLPNATPIPLHQMIAKNAGIRRARGQFVLATNLDIVFSPELMEFLAARQLDPKAMYRMDRFDVDNRIPPGASLDELIDFCKTHVIRVLAREGAYDTDGGEIFRPVEKPDIVAPDSGLRLGRHWYTVEQYPESPFMRYFEDGATVHFERPGNGARQIVFDVEPGPSAQDGWVELEVLDAGGMPVAAVKVSGRDEVRLTLPDNAPSGTFGLRVRHGGIAIVADLRLTDLRVFSIRWDGPANKPGWQLEVLRHAPTTDWVKGSMAHSPYAPQMRNPRYLHTNACGDFTMLSREAWFALRGYPEFPIWPTHLDSFLCYAAYHAGFREVILEDPLRVFHIDHAAVWTPDSEEERGERAARIGVDLVPYRNVVKFFQYMRRFNTPIIFTPESWGLRDVVLPETRV